MTENGRTQRVLFGYLNGKVQPIGVIKSYDEPSHTMELEPGRHYIKLLKREFYRIEKISHSEQIQ